MEKLSKENKLIFKLIDECGLAFPLSKEVKKHIDASSKRVLKKSLKMAGKYSFSMALYIQLHYLRKQLEFWRYL